ncbi:MAG: hypothetical protein HONBIEJF_00749 [Fimbriimonadaceae bacterium]|nr:hypothetical protein [Fimbriimonadaceae bacterium]
MTLNGFYKLAIAALLVPAVSYSVEAQAKRRATSAPVSRTRAETGLIGVKLFQSGSSLVARFGNPQQIQAVTIGGAGLGPSGGGGGGAPGFGRPGGFGGGQNSNPGGGGGGAGITGPDMNVPDDFGFANDFLQAGKSLPGQGSGGRGGAMSAPSQGGPGMGPGAAPSGGGGGARAGGGSTGGDAGVMFTRWVYEKGGSRYGFILDNKMRVVQIEGIGMADSRVRTSRGITLGSQFKQIVKTYGAPDGYEIAGDNIVMRYLVRQKVAFRLSRLDPKKPHQVTGIVVAAGK